MEWLGTVETLVSILSFRTENPPILWQPPPPWDVIGNGNGDQTIFLITCLSSHLGGGMSSDTQERLLVSSDSSVTVLRSNRVVGFGICFGEKVLKNMESSPFSSPIITTSHQFRGISTHVQNWSESKLFCCFTMVLSIFTGFCNGSALDFPFLISLQFCNENLCLKALQI
jgi:hypothetical protein